MSFLSKRQPQPDTQVQEAQRPAQPQFTPTTIGFETVLGANSVLTGDLVASANVRLDGTFTGTLNIAGNVLIGETAKINADVNARNISIAGAVRGNVNGKKVQLLRTGRVWGDISATALSTEEGAFIDGKISMVSPEVAAPAPEPLEVDEIEPEFQAAPEPQTHVQGASSEDLTPEAPEEEDRREGDA
jgi:cytoskeletal protein CcmA (bactofilin family)